MQGMVAGHIDIMLDTPAVAMAQVRGGSCLGIGHALTQKWVYDPHYGVPLAKRFHYNKPPTILDVPLTMDADAVGLPDPETPVGARGTRGPSTSITVYGPSDASTANAELGQHLVADGKTAVPLNITVQHRFCNASLPAQTVHVAFRSGVVRFLQLSKEQNRDGAPTPVPRRTIHPPLRVRQSPQTYPRPVPSRQYPPLALPDTLLEKAMDASRPTPSASWDSAP